MIPPAWSTGGLTSEDGALGRPLAFEIWRAPEFVRVRDGWLVWHEGLGSRQIQPGPNLLEDFLQIPDRPAERAAAYARRWGVLGICEHGLPLTHNPPPRPMSARHLPVTWCRPLPADEGWFTEPVDAWHRYARQMRAVLNIAARLHQGQQGSDQDWRVLYYKAEGPAPWWKRGIAADRSMLVNIVNEWIAIAGVRIACRWGLDGNAAILLSGGSLFGTIIVQLAMAITRTDGLAVCSGCGVSYIPSRRPRSNQRRYCSNCRRRKIPVRDAATDYRHRQETSTARKP